VCLCKSRGSDRAARTRYSGGGVPATDIFSKVGEKFAPPPQTMEAELEAGFLGPFILGEFRKTFAPYIRNGETLVCVQAATDERIKTAVALLKLYTPI